MKNLLTKKSILNLIILLVLFTILKVYSQSFSLKRIKDTTEYFNDQRKSWINKQIHFLSGNSLQKKNFYFDFYWDPGSRVNFKPTYQDLTKKDGLIIAAYEGNLKGSFTKMFLRQTHIFWEIQLLNNQEKKVWYRDDLTSLPLNFAFLHQFEEAKKNWLDKFLWSRGVNFLVAHPSDDSLFYVQNLDCVRVIDIQWGDFGNYPLRYIIEKENGAKGYIDVADQHDFGANWHVENPYAQYPDWSHDIWELIRKKKVRTGMSFDMVRMSQGEPIQKKDFVEDGKKIEVWAYHGVNNRVYVLVFINDKLADMQFVDFP